MLRERVKNCYDRLDLNCAESLLWSANEEYNLGLDRNDLRVISGFGGGMCCERDCGALCGSIAALSLIIVKSKAHDCEEMKDACAGLVEKFKIHLNSCNCAELKKMYRTEEDRCMKTLELAADVLEEYLQGFLPEKEDQRV